MKFHQPSIQDPNLLDCFRIDLGAEQADLRAFALPQVLMPTNDAFAALGNGVITSMVLAPNLEKLRQVRGEIKAANWRLFRGFKQIQKVLPTYLC